jgi:signal transduction histidine kinase
VNAPNYDSLTRAGLELRTALEGLRRDGAAASRDAARDIGPRVDALAHTVRQKLVLVEYFSMIRDLTARRALEETARQQELQLIQANKMTALGTLVSGVAHEINNPNHVVLMNAVLLRDAWDDALEALDGRRQGRDELSLAGVPYAQMRTTTPTLLQDIRDGAGRIQRIVGDLKDFARPRPRDARDRFVLNDAVERALRLLAHAVRSRTNRLEVRLAPDMPVMEGDAQQVEQVVVNLVMNALEALPDRDRGVVVSTAVAAGAHAAVLEVRDEGVGIPAEHLARLRDPFFTTKHDSGGTGLGLAITASLVRAHGGRLDFASEPGRGTRAIVTLPLAGTERRAAALGVDARDTGTP